MKTTIPIILIVLFSLFSTGWCDDIKDKKGRQISTARPYARIISLYGAHTENLFSLGAGNQLIGVSINDDYPAEVNRKKRFSYHDGPEKYLAANPDLVLIRPMIDNGYPQFVRQLESYGIVVVSLQPATIEEMYDYWRTLGKLCGREIQAAEMVARFKGRIEAISRTTSTIRPKKRVYFQAIHQRMKTFTPGSMPLFALKTAGGINVASDAQPSRNTNVAIYGKEKILSKADDIDVIIAQKGLMNPVHKADILNEPGFHIISAVKNNQVFLIDESIVSRPVPRLIEGIMTIGNYLYPHIFSQFNPTEDKL